MLREIIFTVREDEAGVRLDAYLTRKLQGPSREAIQKMIREQLRPMGPERLKPASIVKTGLRFAVTHDAPAEEPLPNIPVIHDDGAVLVVDKPANLAIHPAGRHHLHTLTAALAARPGERAHPAHRLDRETSGLVVCGIGYAASSGLKRAFAEGEVQKSYSAICEGWPARDHFAVDLPLSLGSGPVRVRMSVESGKPARTEVQLVRRYQDAAGQPFALLACSPRTGRQHQIRAHLAASGLPLVGDKIYGADETIFIRFTEGGMTDDDRQRLRLNRHALHAAELAFRHPILDTPLRFESPLPADLAGFLGQLQALE